MTPLLSILINTIPNRRKMADDLWDRLEIQIDRGYHGDAEMLMLRDNKMRSIGAKRQSLLDAANGRYVAFVDDDDWVADDYVESICRCAIEEQPDLIVWPIRVTINGEQDGIVEPSVKYAPKNGEPLAEYKPSLTLRPPHQLLAWRRTLAQCSRFPDTAIGEDFAWAAKLWPLVDREVRISRVLYWWRHDIRMREHEETPA